MNILKITISTVLLAMIAGCSGSGPMKAYDEATVTDKNQLAIIYLPPDLEVEEVNGIKQDTPFIETGFNEVHVLPGKHNIVLAYERFWGDAASGHLVSSKPVTLTLDVNAGQKYVIKFKVPKDQWDATLLVSNFRPWVETKSGQKIATKSTIGKVINASTDKTSGSSSGLSAEEIVARQKPLEKLKFWWKLADKDDRKAFQKWLKEQ
ncbi:MAG: DUF2057 domain-containing protein [Gammaproteobacteria bacterium]|nr:DUF2057 domain-containing protein [Gammaproteobacteria bacterium]MDH5778746.1 DUF2057 domain-containing protein [Gammaproteobacteria bacterium]